MGAPDRESLRAGAGGHFDASSWGARSAVATQAVSGNAGVTHAPSGPTPTSLGFVSLASLISLPRYFFHVYLLLSYFSSQFLKKSTLPLAFKIKMV